LFAQERSDACFLQVSASAIKATGTSRPFEDLEYIWDFGDPTGKEIFENPANQRTVNANYQDGPEAAYCYRNPGTYTVTLTVRGKNGQSFLSAKVTQAVTVTAFNASGGEYWFDSVNGKDTNSGANINSPKQSVSALNELLRIPNRRFNIKRGSSWAGSMSLDISSSPTRLAPYGLGDNPSFSITNGSNNTVNLLNGRGDTAQPKSDVVVSGIDFSTSPNAAGSFAGNFLAAHTRNPAGTFDNIYIDNCNFTATGAGKESSTPLRFQRISGPGGFNNMWACGIWGGSMVNQTAVRGNAVGIFGGAYEWMFYVGCHVRGAGTSNVFDHHIYPTVQFHALYRWIKFGSGPNRNYCINTNCDLYGTVEHPEIAEYHLIADCEMTGAKRAFDASNGNNNLAGLFRNFVAQGNAMHDLDGNGVIIFSSCDTMTVRDNLVWNCTGGIWFAPSKNLAAVFRGQVYRNKIYQPAGTPSLATIYYVGATWTTPQQITDNIIQDQRTTANCLSSVFADHIAAGSLIDRNKYWAPNDIDRKFLYNQATPQSFVQWQASGFDANGSVADPKWPDPTKGQFS